jgi:hypothetical protein
VSRTSSRLECKRRSWETMAACCWLSLGGLGANGVPRAIARLSLLVYTRSSLVSVSSGSSDDERYDDSTDARFTATALLGSFTTNHKSRRTRLTLCCRVPNPASGRKIRLIHVQLYRTWYLYVTLILSPRTRRKKQRKRKNLMRKRRIRNNPTALSDWTYGHG